MATSDVKRQLKWLEYWEGALKAQRASDQDAMMSDGKPLYEDDVDRAINDLIVGILLVDIEYLRLKLDSLE